jgi:hypothetical protein
LIRHDACTGHSTVYSLRLRDEVGIGGANDDTGVVVDPILMQAEKVAAINR